MDMTMQQELSEMRLNRLEKLTSALVESQSSTVVLMQDFLKRVEKRLERVETNQGLMMDDLAFIKNYLQERGGL